MNCRSLDKLKKKYKNNIPKQRKKAKTIGTSVYKENNITDKFIRNIENVYIIISLCFEII